MKLSRPLILVVLLAGAIFFYAIGMVFGAIALLVIGGLLELGFWIGLFKPARHQRTDGATHEDSRREPPR